MLSILVPTDYSACATNAVNYAISFAKYFDASVTILHAVEHAGKPFGNQDEEGDSNKQLNDLKEQLRAQHEEIQINTMLVNGYALSEIYKAAESRDYDMLIMGTHGSSRTAGFEGAPLVFESLFGSVTAGLVGYCCIPMLIVHENESFIEPKEFVLLSDFHQMPSTDSYRFLSMIASKFDSRVNILYIENKPTYLSEAFSQMNRIEKIFEGLEFEYTIIKSENVEQTLIEMPFDQDQIITVISKEKTGIREFLGHSTSQDLASYLNASLLVLPEYIAIYPDAN